MIKRFDVHRKLGELKNWWRIGDSHLNAICHSEFIRLFVLGRHRHVTVAVSDTRPRGDNDYYTIHGRKISARSKHKTWNFIDLSRDTYEPCLTFTAANYLEKAFPRAGTLYVWVEL